MKDKIKIEFCKKKEISTKPDLELKGEREDRTE